MSAADEGKAVLRFTATERALHWGFALGYFILLVSGLPLMFPTLRGLIRGYSPVIGLRLHLAGAWLWIVVMVTILVIGNRDVLRQTWRQLTTFGPEDRQWLGGFPRWLVGRRGERERIDERVGRFNAAQKLNAIFTIVSSILLLITGAALVPSALGVSTGSGVGGWRWAHGALTLLALIPLLAHLYLALVHPATRASLRGMIGGRVDAAWAAAHYPRWDFLSEGAPAAPSEASPGGRADEARENVGEPGRTRNTRERNRR